MLGHVIRGKKPEPPEGSRIAPLHWEFIQRCWLSRAYRPTAGEIVVFIACERDALVCDDSDAMVCDDSDALPCDDSDAMVL